MIEKLLRESKLVITSGDRLGFQEVLDSLSNTKNLLIVTYNFDNGTLLKLIKEIGNKINVVIYTNIPNRFPKDYWGSTASIRAKKSIGQYMELLEPGKLGEKVTVKFCFINHSKIIATDTHAYIGSGNFSQASSGNIEAGIIITQDVPTLTLDVVELLDENCVDYVVAKSNLETVLNVYEGVIKAVDRFKEKNYITFEDEPEPNGRFISSGEPVGLSIGELERFQEMVDFLISIEDLPKVGPALKKIVYEIFPKAELAKFSSFLDSLDLYVPLSERDNLVQRFASQLSPLYEDVDELSDKAIEKADEELYELSEKFSSNAETISAELTHFQNDWERFIGRINNHSLIDNT